MLHFGVTPHAALCTRQETPNTVIQPASKSDGTWKRLTLWEISDSPSACDPAVHGDKGPKRADVGKADGLRLEA